MYRLALPLSNAAASTLGERQNRLERRLLQHIIEPSAEALKASRAFEQKLVAVGIPKARAGAPRHPLGLFQELHAGAAQGLESGMNVLAFEDDRRLTSNPMRSRQNSSAFS